MEISSDNLKVLLENLAYAGRKQGRAEVEARQHRQAFLDARATVKRAWFWTGAKVILMLNAARDMEDASRAEEEATRAIETAIVHLMTEITGEVPF